MRTRIILLTGLLLLVFGLPCWGADLHHFVAGDLAGTVHDGASANDGLATVTVTATITVTNATTLTATAGEFTGVVAGDVVYVQKDASNKGWFTVATAAATSLSGSFLGTVGTIVGQTGCTSSTGPDDIIYRGIVDMGNTAGSHTIWVVGDYTDIWTVPIDTTVVSATQNLTIRGMNAVTVPVVTMHKSTAATYSWSTTAIAAGALVIRDLHTILQHDDAGTGVNFGFSDASSATVNCTNVIFDSTSHDAGGVIASSYDVCVNATTNPVGTVTFTNCGFKTSARMWASLRVKNASRVIVDGCYWPSGSAPNGTGILVQSTANLVEVENTGTANPANEFGIAKTFVGISSGDDPTSDAAGPTGGLVWLHDNPAVTARSVIYYNAGTAPTTTLNGDHNEITYTAYDVLVDNTVASKTGTGYSFASFGNNDPLDADHDTRLLGHVVFRGSTISQGDELTSHLVIFGGRADNFACENSAFITGSGYAAVVKSRGGVFRNNRIVAPCGLYLCGAKDIQAINNSIVSIADTAASPIGSACIQVSDNNANHAVPEATVEISGHNIKNNVLVQRVANSPCVAFTTYVATGGRQAVVCDYNAYYLQGSGADILTLDNGSNYYTTLATAQAAWQALSPIHAGYGNDTHSHLLSGAFNGVGTSAYSSNLWRVAGAAVGNADHGGDLGAVQTTGGDDSYFEF